MNYRFKFASVMLTVILIVSSSAAAQYMHDPAQDKGAKAPVRPALLDEIGIDQKLGDKLPLELTFKDESGRTVTLRDYFGHGKPVLLNFVYYECPMLCGEVLNGVSAALKVLKFAPGKEFEVVTVSIDPRETPTLAAAKKETYMARLGREGAEKGWHFLTGEEENIKALTDAAGFHYVWDPKMQQYAHAAGIMLVTPEGKLAQYYYGVEYSARDMRLGIIEASKERIGNLADKILLYCYHYDPQTGKYGAIVSNIMRLGGATTVVVLGGFLIVMFRREGSGRLKGRRA